MLFDSKKVAELQAQVATLESEKAQATADLEKLECALNEKNAVLETANASVISLTARAEKAETELAAATAAKATAEANAAAAIASVDDKVTDTLAAAGVAPIQKDVKATDPTNNPEAPSRAKGIAGARALLTAKHEAKHAKK